MSALSRWWRMRTALAGQRHYRTRVRLDDPPRVLGTVVYRRGANPPLWTADGGA